MGQLKFARRKYFLEVKPLLSDNLRSAQFWKRKANLSGRQDLWDGNYTKIIGLCTYVNSVLLKLIRQ